MAAQPSKPRWNHDVFLSFRGEDTRKNFTDHLYTALVRAGIHTFRDDEELPRGEHISTELLKAIQGSRISIVVFSKDYASSRWCLDELVEIINTLGGTVFPIFYDVDPSDVRRQAGTFAKAFSSHKERFEAERVQMWRAALTKAGGLSGFCMQNIANGYESKFIQKIVKGVLRRVSPTYLHVAKYPVEIKPRVKEIKDLLNLGTSDVCSVGIYGMGGIGKTTIAKAVYKKIYHQFEGSSFLFNIKEASKQPNGLVCLQKQLVSNILKRKDWEIDDVNGGINLITKRCCHKKVLVVLDDVDHLKQLDSLVGNFELFGQGSRLIVTTRDEHVLTELRVNEKYKVEEMKCEESLQLFCKHAFRMTEPAEDFKELSRHMVDYVGGLPLAAEVLGSYLLERSIIEWKNALAKLQKIPHRDIQKVLRISYDSLEDEKLKGTFLDIACFFIGTNREYASKVLASCGFFPDIDINILCQRSLLIVNERNELMMHDLVRNMGREIVREMSPENPEKRNRLWFHEDVLDVLNKNLGSEAIQGLVVNMHAHEDIQLKTEAFAKMTNLRLLQIDGAYLTGCYEHLPKDLRWLHWHKCPLEFLPAEFHLKNLVILDMENSNVKQVWKHIKIFNKLKHLNLSGSKYLTQSPNFSRVPHLEILLLEDCTSLVEVHDSIGHLKKLVLLNLQGCKNLKNLPESISNSESLETLNLSDSINLDKLPKQLGNMVALTELHADRIAIKQLPYSFGLLKNLTTLSLSGCKGQSSKSWMPCFLSLLSPKCPKPINLLSSVSGLCSLIKMDLSDCNLFEDGIPIDLGSLSSLKELNLSRNKFCRLPKCIGHLPKLDVIHLNECTSLQSILELPASLSRLFASGCSSLQRLPDVWNEEISSAYFYLESCDSLAYDFSNSLPQYLSRCGRSRIIVVPGDEVPNWFNHKSIGTSISFQIPSLPKGQIKGLFVCAVYAPKQETGPKHALLSIIINSCPSLYQFSCEIRKDHTCIIYIPNSFIEAKIARGMEIKMNCEGDKYFEVKKCGAHILVDEPNAMDGDVDSDTCRD